MMFPLKQRKISGYTFGQLTHYNNFHLGTDYACGVEELYAPSNGVILWEGFGSQGGYTIHFKPDNNNVIMRFMHLKEFRQGQERVNQGDIIAITDSTGLSIANHLHVDISKNSIQINNTSNFIDPETYNWGQEVSMGFSDENMALIVDRTLRKQRLITFGKVDSAGLSADKKSAMTKIKTGNVDVLADILLNYSKAPNNLWVKKTDYTSLEKKYKQLLIQKEQIDEAYLKCQKDLKLCQGKECPPKDCNAEIMAEKSLRKVCEDTLKGKIDPKDCPPSDIDDLSPGELIAKGIRKFLGIK